MDWRIQIEKRGKEKEKKVKKKERIVGKKETYRERVVVKVRTSYEGTIVTYDIDVNGVITTCHRKYMSKIKNADNETEDSGYTEGENTARGESRASSQQ